MANASKRRANVAKSKRHGSNAYLNYQRHEDFLIARIDSREESGKRNEEDTTPTRTEKDGTRVWQY
jgi:hypothetical protein